MSIDSPDKSTGKDVMCMVFWPHDLFPYFLAAPGNLCMRPVTFEAKLTLCWYIPSYQFYVENPLLITDLDCGKELNETASRLVVQRRKEMSNIHNMIINKFNSLVPPELTLISSQSSHWD